MSKKKNTASEVMEQSELLSFPTDLLGMLHEVTAQDEKPKVAIKTDAAIPERQEVKKVVTQSATLQNSDAVGTPSSSNVPATEEVTDKVKNENTVEVSHATGTNEKDGSSSQTEPVEQSEKEVKKSNKSKGNDKGKEDVKDGKQKADAKKKDKHKPFRRSRGIDLVSETKKEFFSMRLSGKELEKLSNNAAKCRMSTSTYLRELALNTVPRTLSDEEREALDKTYRILNDGYYHVRQMQNYFRSAISMKDEDGKEVYERKTWNELKEVIKVLKAALECLNKEFRIYKK